MWHPICPVLLLVSLPCAENRYVSIDVATVAGGQSASLLDGEGSQAQFLEPRGIVHVNGVLYVADSGNSVVRKIDDTHHVTTFSGNGKVGITNGKAQEASFVAPMDLTYDPQSNLLLISDDTFLRTVRLHDGFVQSIPLVQYPIWGIAVHGHFLAITVPDVDQVLVLLVHCEQEYICRCKTTYSTTGLCYASGSEKNGHVDGIFPRSSFNRPHGIAFLENVLYVADTGNHAIRAISFSADTFADPSLLYNALVTTVTGTDGRGFNDGRLDVALFNSPFDLCVMDKDESKLVVADRDNHRIRIIDLFTDEVYTLAGRLNGFADGPGDSSRFSTPEDVACSSSVIWISDTGNHAIRQVTYSRSNEGTAELATFEVQKSDSSKLFIYSFVFLASLFIVIIVKNAVLRGRKQQYRLVPSMYVNETTF